MKQLILIAFFFSGYSSFAQNNISKKLVLLKGQKIHVTSTNVSDADMGMGMQMKNQSTSNSTLEVTGENENDYTLTTTVTKIKATIDAMGQTHEFDSEKQEHHNTEIGKSFSDIIGKPASLNVNKYSGVIRFTKSNSPEKEAEPMEGVMEALGGNGDDVSVNGAFIIVPPGKKSGESWTQSDSSVVSKTKTVFTINSLTENTAIISFIKTSAINNAVDVQGSQMNITVNSISKGEATTDILTGLVSKSVVDTDIDGTMEIMGQSMPLTGKTILVSNYTFEK